MLGDDVIQEGARCDEDGRLPPDDCPWPSKASPPHCQLTDAGPEYFWLCVDACKDHPACVAVSFDPPSEGCRLFSSCNTTHDNPDIVTLFIRHEDACSGRGECAFAAQNSTCECEDNFAMPNCGYPCCSCVRISGVGCGPIQWLQSNAIFIRLQRSRRACGWWLVRYDRSHGGGLRL